VANWKKNLVAVWLSQFLSISGFSLALPFAPFFIQQLGVTDPDAVKFWAAVATSATAWSVAFAAPIWGILADRYGRKIMLLRANFCAMAILFAMGFSPNVHTFVVLKLLQGLFTGTINAAMTVIATCAPQERQGMALGTLSTAVFAGSLFGPTVGGILAEEVGYRNAFMLSSVLLLAAGIIVLLAVREDFVPPDTPAARVSVPLRARMAGFGPGFPILVLIFMMAIARTFDQPILPLFVQEILGSLEGASRWTGMLNGTGALGAMLAGFLLGRLADRIAPPFIGKMSAAAAGVFMGITGLFPVFAVLFPARFLLAFCAGGLDPVFMVWLSKVTPSARRGTTFGWAVTARSIGWGLAPILSATIAVVLDIRYVYFVGILAYWLLIPAIHRVSRHVAAL